MEEDNGLSAERDEIVLGGQITDLVANGFTLTLGNGNWNFDNVEVCGNDRYVDPDTVAIYSKQDVDKLVMMLTLWIDDVAIRNKVEEMFKYWKDIQK